MTTKYVEAPAGNEYLKILILKDSRSETGIEGSATYVLTVCREFRAAGVEHTVVFNKKNLFFDQLTSEGTEVLLKELPPNGWRNYLHPIRLLRMRRDMTRIIEEGGYSHVWAHFSGLLTLITNRVRKNGVKIIAHQHSAMPEGTKLTLLERKNFFSLKLFLSAAYRKFVLFNFAKADLVICLTNDGKNTSIDTYGVSAEKIRIVPNGTDFGEKSFDFNLLLGSKLKSNQKTIISVGRETVEKGVVDFCKLAANLADRSDVKFIFLGGGRNPEFQESLHQQYGAYVDFAGMQFPIDEYFKEAYLQVFLTHREGQGIVLGEAAQFGVPSVTWDAVGVREVMAESGLGPIVKFQDFEELTRQVARLLDNDRHYEELSKHVHAGRDHFTSKKNFERMMSHFNEV